MSGWVPQLLCLGRIGLDVKSFGLTTHILASLSRSDQAQSVGRLRRRQMQAAEAFSGRENRAEMSSTFLMPLCLLFIIDDFKHHIMDHAKGSDYGRAPES